MLRKLCLKPLLKVRARRLGKHIHSSTHDCTTILDVGCGDTVLSAHLMRKYRRNVTPIDTIDSNLTNVSVRLYDGQTIPFPDKSFDATMVIFVLHHCQDIENVLREIMRVTRKKIIIVEEIFGNRVSEFILHCHDKGNVFYSSKMDIPLNFKTRQGWQEMFDKLQLRVTSSDRIYQYPFLNLTNQVLFEVAV